MNVLIVEDESLARERLCELIHQYDSKINIVDQFDSIEETVHAIEHDLNVDLAFFDIQLSDGLSFEIFNKTKFDKPVIFTTAYDNYAVNAFKVNSVDYLLKPINFEELSKAIGKFNSNRPRYEAGPVAHQNLEQLIKDLQKPFKKRFIVKFGDQLQFKAADEIAYLYAEGKTVYIVSNTNNRKYIIDHTLEELEHKLLNPDEFFRINRKFIININAIENIRNYSNSRLKVFVQPPPDLDMIVSREKVNEFKSWIDQ